MRQPRDWVPSGVETKPRASSCTRYWRWMPIRSSYWAVYIKNPLSVNQPQREKPRPSAKSVCVNRRSGNAASRPSDPFPDLRFTRSEEHTSELQSHLNLVCRLLLEKKKKTINPSVIHPLLASNACRNT